MSGLTGSSPSWRILECLQALGGSHEIDAGNLSSALPRPDAEVLSCSKALWYLPNFVLVKCRRAKIILGATAFVEEKLLLPCGPFAVGITAATKTICY